LHRSRLAKPGCSKKAFIYGVSRETGRLPGIGLFFHVKHLRNAEQIQHQKSLQVSRETG
jgi:hypothetical protein